MKNSLLLVTNARSSETVGGRQQLSWLHRRALAAICGERLLLYELGAARAPSRWAALQGYLDGLSPAVIAGIIALAREREASQVYLDGSNLGLVAAILKRVLPRVEVLTFCHNVEARFFLGSFLAQRSLHAAGVLLANYLAERRTVRSSDRIIALSQRDDALFKRIYGRGATDILPMALSDHASIAFSEPSSSTASFALFVGGAFYANLQGLLWYARYVAPHVALRTIVVGRGMEALQGELQKVPGLEIIGGVADLAPWYHAAAVTVAPIFDGSGMKTKVAEALMFGKHVVGTPEAFSGYASDIIRANWNRADADGFIAALRDITERPPVRYDPVMRLFYERDHSPAAAQMQLSKILGR